MKELRKNDRYAVYKGRVYRFYKNPDLGIFSDKKFTLQADYSHELLKENFKQYTDPELSNKLYKNIAIKDIESAFRLATYCKYKDGNYCILNIRDGKIILSPEIETLINMGRHPYDFGIYTIEVSYELFLNEVEEIWEVRKPIEGFRFDVEPIFYIK